MESTPDENHGNHEENGKSCRMSRLKLALRLLIYGLPLLLLISMLNAMFLPGATPKAVLRIEHERQRKSLSGRKTAPPLEGQQASVRPESGGGASPTSGTLTLHETEKPLFTEALVPPPLRSRLDKWNQHYRTLMQGITDYERAAAGLPFQFAYQWVHSLFMKLWELSREVDTWTHFELSKLPNQTEAWAKFTTPVFQDMKIIWARLAEDMLENCVRHERWVAAANFCEISLHDHVQARYYWRQWGGRQGLFQAAALSIGRPWDAVMVSTHRGYSWTVIKRSFFPAPLDNEANWAPNPIFGPTPLDKRLPY